MIHFHRASGICTFCHARSQSRTVILPTLFISRCEAMFHGKSVNVAPVGPPDWQAMFPAQNTERKKKICATHVRQNSESLPELFFLLIAYANFISRVAVKVLVQSFFLALSCFSIPDVSEKKKKKK